MVFHYEEALYQVYAPLRLQVNVLEPHPHLPLLATSGLDNDVKLWMPTASEPANMSTLQRASCTGLLLHKHTQVSK